MKYFVDLGMYDEIEYLLTKLPAGKEVGKLLDIVLGKSTKTLNIEEKNRSISAVQSESLPSENSLFTSDPDQKFKICEILINHFSKMKFRMLGSIVDDSIVDYLTEQGNVKIMSCLISLPQNYKSEAKEQALILLLEMVHAGINIHPKIYANFTDSLDGFSSLFNAIQLQSKSSESGVLEDDFIDSLISSILEFSIINEEFGKPEIVDSKFVELACNYAEATGKRLVFLNSLEELKLLEERNREKLAFLLPKLIQWLRVVDTNEDSDQPTNYRVVFLKCLVLG